MCAEKYTLLIVQYNGEVSVCHKKVTKFWQVGKLFWQVGKAEGRLNPSIYKFLYKTGIRQMALKREYSWLYQSSVQKFTVLWHILSLL